MAERTGNHLANNDMLIERYTADGVGYEIIPQIKSAFHDGVLSVGDVWKYVAQFPYMPRIIDREVFNQAVEDAESCPLDESARFALASDRNPETGEFRNLIISGVTDSAKSVQVTDSTLIVDWDVAVAAYEEAKEVVVHYGLLDKEQNLYGISEDDGSRLGEVLFSTSLE